MTVNNVVTVTSERWVNLHAAARIVLEEPLICQIKNHHNVNVIFVDSVLEPPQTVDGASGLETNGALSVVTSDPGVDEFTWARLRGKGSCKVSVQGTIEFFPSDIPGMVLWLDAQDSSTFITGAGNKVQQWNDKSGAGNDVIQAVEINQPEQVSSGINGFPSVFFDIQDMSLDTTGSALINSDSISVYVAMSADFPAIGESIFLSLSNSGEPTDFNNIKSISFNNEVFITESRVGYTRNQFSNVIVSPAEDVSFIYSSFFDGVNNNSYLNGLSAGFPNPDPNTGTFETDKFRVGAGKILGDTFGTDWDGNIGEVFIYNRVLTDIERRDLNSYLSFKWNIFA